MTDSTLLRAPHEHRLLAVLDHARRTVAMLEVVNSPWQTPLDAYATLADKIVMETALLVLVAGRVPAPPPPLVDACRVLAASLVPHVRSERHQGLLRRHPHAAVSLGMAHQALCEAGFPDAAFDALVEDAFASGQAQAAERLPYRHMEMLWLQTLRGSPPSPATWSSAIACSLLANEAQAVHMTADSVYALTHGLMYVTDFGRQPLPAGVDEAGIARMLDACLAWHAVSENLDLVGELLLGAVMTGAAHTPPAQVAWAVLNHAWAEFGFLPCPSFELGTYLTLPDNERAAYAYVHTYHTTYVAGIVSAVILTRGCAALGWELTTPREDPDATLTAAVERLLAYQAESAKTPLWLEVISAVPLTPQATALVLHDALLLLAAHEHRWDVVQEALEASDRTGERSPTVEATGTVLTRIQSGLIKGTYEADPRLGTETNGRGIVVNQAPLEFDDQAGRITATAAGGGR